VFLGISDILNLPELSWVIVAIVVVIVDY